MFLNLFYLNFKCKHSQLSVSQFLIFGAKLKFSGTNSNLAQKKWKLYIIMDKTCKLHNKVRINGIFEILTKSIDKNRKQEAESNKKMLQNINWIKICKIFTCKLEQLVNVMNDPFFFFWCYRCNHILSSTIFSQKLIGYNY